MFPGFRRDLPNEGNAGFLKTLDQASAKVLPLETDTRLFSSEMGRLENTGLETDVAILNEGLFLHTAREWANGRYREEVIFLLML